MKNLKEQKRANDDLRKYYMIESLANKKTQADYIKSQQNIAEEKRRAIELEKKNKIKLELEKKIAEEQLKIQEAELRKLDLEQKENEVLNKIKTTTQIHQAEVENYEKLSKSGIKNRKYFQDNDFA